MTRAVPIGQAESQQLEFKGSQALRKPISIVREVTAMLNSGYHGEVWVGVVERDEKAVGIETIENVASERRRIEDALIDLIEPSPGRNEVEVHAVASDAGNVLMIEVKANPPRSPYALRKDGGRVYATRVGARIRPLARDEIRDAFRADGAADDRQETALERARSELHPPEAIIDTALLRVVPAYPQGLDLTKEERETLADPERTGSRAGGWTYGNAFSRFEPGHNAWKLDFGTPGGVLRTKIRAGGSLEFRADLTQFEHEHPRELYPLALLEYPTSVLRLFREVHKHNKAPKPGPCAVGLSLFGVRGWKLRPFSPKSLGFLTEHPGYEHHVFRESDGLVVDLDSVEWEDLLAPDDRVALRLIRGVYRSFGYEDDAIPAEFDQERMVLRIPQ